jgi:hypothetical protein
MPAIPIIWEAQIRRIVVLAQHRQELVRPPSQQKSWAWWYMPIILAIQEM